METENATLKTNQENYFEVTYQSNEHSNVPTYIVVVITEKIKAVCDKTNTILSENEEIDQIRIDIPLSLISFSNVLPEDMDGSPQSCERNGWLRSQLSYAKLCISQITAYIEVCGECVIESESFSI